MFRILVSPGAALTSPRIQALVSAKWLGTRPSLKSPLYRIHAKMSCFVLLKQEMLSALDFALASAGRSNPARMAMMAMTTSSSMSVKARRQGGRPGLFPHAGNSDSGIRDLSQDVCHCVIGLSAEDNGLDSARQSSARHDHLCVSMHTRC